MRFAYVLPEPSKYPCREDFDGDLECMRRAGYDAVELQVADPAQLDEESLHASLSRVGYELCAVQTGGTYATRGNCLCTADEAVRRRTRELLHRFVAFAERFGAVVVFGTLQGTRREEPDPAAALKRIDEALRELAAHATRARVTVAYEPVNHLEVSFRNTIESVAEVVRRIGMPGLRLMIDTFHMNIEERDATAPLAAVADILAHVHLSETNRDVLGAGHWPTAEFLRELGRLGYEGVVSVGVYNTCLPRRECIERCMAHLRALRQV